MSTLSPAILTTRERVPSTVESSLGLATSHRRRADLVYAVVRACFVAITGRGIRESRNGKILTFVLGSLY